ncbi:(d)CMP kinase [Thorsellia anophelis]|uniref:Cytidylate kinase n=1 Tax=Thorsellia anophelis DSM 18579 TaxID=1123402 RepID=A0A1H9ZCM9_9GAMM|nr:(d)CMP kinase [Thorsellia anophelis]SES79381.1 cytidylate kinase [Thorsellia anophelis DSM 18579]
MKNEQIDVPIITVDGPSGVGKGTLSQALAQHFGWTLLDSGAIYRVLALSILNKGLENAPVKQLVETAKALNVEFKSHESSIEVYLDGVNVTKAVRQESTGIAASKIATIAEVRDALLQRQRNFAIKPGLVADGRDMGTVVFPNASVKLFIDASTQARADRRIYQLKQAGAPCNPEEVLQDIIERDKRDRNRAVAPLIAAVDALIIDTTHLTITEVYETALKFIMNKFSLGK